MATMKPVSNTLAFIPEDVQFLFKPLPSTALESIELQINFLKSQQTYKNVYVVLSEACMSLLKDRKIWVPYFGYVATKMAYQTSQFDRILELEHSKDHKRYPEILPMIGAAHILRGKVWQGIEESKNFDKIYKFNSESPASLYPLIEAKLNISSGYLGMSRWQDAKKELEELEATMDYFKRHHADLDLSFFEVKVILYRCQVLLLQGNFQESFQRTQELHKRVCTMKSLELKSDVKLWLSALYGAARDQKTAQHYLTEAYDLYIEYGNYLTAAYAKGAQGIYYMNANDPKGALIVEAVVADVESYGSVSQVIELTTILARFYSSKDKEKAFNLAKKIDKAIQAQDYDSDPILLVALASIATDTFNLSFADKYLRMVEAQLAKEYNVVTDISLQYERALYEIAKVNLTEAERLIRSALALAEKHSNWQYINRCKNHFVEIVLDKFMVNQRKEDLKAGEECLHDLLLILPNSPMRVFCLIYLAGMQFLMRNFSDMETSISLAKDMCQKENYKQLINAMDRWDKDLHEAKCIVENKETPSKELVMTELRIASQVLSAIVVFDTDLQAVDPGQTLKSTVRSVFIISENGLPLFNYNFETQSSSDDVLVSGFLAAISQFSQILSTNVNEGSLQTVKHSGYSLLLEKQMGLIVGLVVNEETYQSRLQLRKFITHIDFTAIQKRVSSAAVSIDQEFTKKLIGTVKTVFPESMKNVETAKPSETAKSSETTKPN